MLQLLTDILQKFQQRFIVLRKTGGKQITTIFTYITLILIEMIRSQRNTFM